MRFVKQGEKIDAVPPNQPATPIVGVRLAPTKREPLERHAKARGLSLSDIVREAIDEYIDRRNLRAEVTP